MPVRFRRRRFLFICITAIFIIIYLIKNYSINRSNEETVLSNEEIEKLVKLSIDKEVQKIKVPTTSTTSTVQLPIAREEFVRIDGKQFKKIDWHDYEAIAREDARKGSIFFI